MYKTWNEFIENEKQNDYYQKLMDFVNNEYKTKKINPEYHNIYRALELTNIDDVKIVILGQDPYPTEDYAVGLAFSVRKESKLPKSLINIFKELEDDINVKLDNGDLTHWAKNGVLLLNSVLTVEYGKPLSHVNKGWEIFTDHILSYLNSLDKKIVYILWGNEAIKKGKILNNPKQLVLTSVHPSPLSAYRGFFGSKPFSTSCDYLNIDYRIWKEEIDS